jgi:hypothetical protein
MVSGGFESPAPSSQITTFSFFPAAWLAVDVDTLASRIFPEIFPACAGTVSNIAATKDSMIDDLTTDLPPSFFQIGMRSWPMQTEQTCAARFAADVLRKKKRDRTEMKILLITLAANLTKVTGRDSRDLQ